ncbi:hypothetical protein [Polyangium jinanense]|uniref:Uncharacterized protein n=1 Tax=Polyangium jinanense TaxID=2829994 RepID=A0A9X3X3K9_9BACT|nr:hypothetical protein [Polyangium jinanense]MDC3962239.1 hypothetical protein [Polyangium jinanense]MDC3983607.1 hypothetical protein [Polyangium jinanense]
MNTISKLGTLLLALSALMAMGTGCAAGASEANTDDDIESAEDATVADADELSTTEDAAALSTGWGPGRYYGGGSCGAPCGAYGYRGACSRGFADDFDVYRGPGGGYGVVGPRGNVGFVGPGGGYGIAGPGGAIGVGPRGNVGFVGPGGNAAIY